jgi:alpha,alpha-trehalase
MLHTSNQDTKANMIPLEAPPSGLFISPPPNGFHTPELALPAGELLSNYSNPELMQRMDKFDVPRPPVEIVDAPVAPVHVPHHRAFPALFAALHDTRVLGPDGMQVTTSHCDGDPLALHRDYERAAADPKFDLSIFVKGRLHPDTPAVPQSRERDTNISLDQHAIDTLYSRVRYEPRDRCSLYGVKFPYIVPGERFRSLYYWDGLEVMRGLAVIGAWEFSRGMLDDYRGLIQRFGFVPNGTEDYFIDDTGGHGPDGRSQPPVLAEMVELQAEHEGDQFIVECLSELMSEHNFFMRGAAELTSENPAHKRVVRLVDETDGEVFEMNRYWGAPVARPESKIEDEETVRQSGLEGEAAKQLLIDIWAAAESGQDFTSRFCRRGGDLTTLHTTEIIPVDLNCLMVDLKRTIARGLRLAGRGEDADKYEQSAAHLAEGIRRFCYNPEKGWCFDYDFVAKRQKNVWSAAAFYALDSQIMGPAAVDAMSEVAEKKFLKHGGIMTTLDEGPQQWQGKKGWSLLQFKAIRGMWRNKKTTLAGQIRRAWLENCDESYRKTGHLYEKHDVKKVGKRGDGGEYAVIEDIAMTLADYLAIKYGAFVTKGNVRAGSNSVPQEKERWSLKNVATTLGSTMLSQVIQAKAREVANK